MALKPSSHVFARRCACSEIMENCWLVASRWERLRFRLFRSVPATLVPAVAFRDLASSVLVSSR